MLHVRLLRQLLSHGRDLQSHCLATAAEQQPTFPLKFALNGPHPVSFQILITEAICGV
jgi:hypothetical protein